MVTHSQVVIIDPVDGSETKVDEGIAPLIRLLWSADLRTTNSCQENEPGVMWVEFLHVGYLEDFISMIIAELGDNYMAHDWLYSRILVTGEDPHDWEYNTYPFDTREYLDEENDMVEVDYSEPCKIIFTASVRFPVTDYDIICSLLKRAVENKSSF